VPVTPSRREKSEALALKPPSKVRRGSILFTLLAVSSALEDLDRKLLGYISIPPRPHGIYSLVKA